MLSAQILVLALMRDLSMEMKIALALTLGFSSKVVAAKVPYEHSGIFASYY